MVGTRGSEMVGSARSATAVLAGRPVPACLHLAGFVLGRLRLNACGRGTIAIQQPLAAREKTLKVFREGTP